MVELKIYLWADLNLKIGFGHFKRLQNLSQACDFLKLNYTYLSNCQDGFFKKHITSLEFPIDYYVKNFELPKYDFKKGSILILDSYFITVNYIKLLKKTFSKVYIFDDFKKNYKDAINIKIGERIKNKNYISGLNIIPLSKNFWNIKEKYTLKNNNLLITFGAIDHYDLTANILKWIKNKKLLFKITIIIGKFYTDQQIQKINQLKKTLDIKLIFRPKNIFNYLNKSSYVICAGGFTIFESLALNKKTLSIALQENQIKNIEYLINNNYVDYVRYFSKKSLSKIQIKVLSFLEETHYINYDQKIIDCEGSINLIKIIINEKK